MGEKKPYYILAFMLSIEKFNSDDIHIIKGLPRASIVYIIILMTYCVPASFLLGLLGLFRDGFGYWATTLGLLLIFTLIIIWLIANDYFLYKKDMAAQIKYCGTIQVIKKPIKEDSKDIYTEAAELKKICIPLKEVFDKINVGDQLYIEISKFSKEIFRLEKNGTSLLKIDL